MVAASGAALILVGIACMVMQLYVSVRDRRKTADVTGDPFDGRTLEWATASPPPAYNFAVLPEIRDREPLLDMKERGVTFQRPAAYEDIHMPKNSAVGVVMGGLAFVLGFAVIWHIWWLVAACGLALWIVLFALLFAPYVIMVDNPAGGPAGKALFSLPNAAIETALLLVSSTTFGFASLSSKTGNRGAVLAWLLLTFVLGAGFVFLELREFAGLIKAGAR